MNKYSNHPQKTNTQTYSHVYDDKLISHLKRMQRQLNLLPVTMVNGRTYMKQVKNWHYFKQYLDTKGSRMIKNVGYIMGWKVSQVII